MRDPLGIHIPEDCNQNKIDNQDDGKCFKNMALEGSKAKPPNQISPASDSSLCKQTKNERNVYLDEENVYLHANTIN